MGRNTLIQVRRGTTVQWSGQNPVLSQGEWGYNTDLGRFKIGDNLTPWNDLCWASIRPTSNDIVGSDGIGIDLSCLSTTGNIPLASIKVTGILSSQINNFNSSVSGLLPDITGVSGVSAVFDSSSNTWTVSLDNPSIEVEDITDFDERVDDRVAELFGVPSGSPFRNISGINLSYLDNDNRIDIGLDNTVVRTTGDQIISGSLEVSGVNVRNITDSIIVTEDVGGIVKGTTLSTASGITEILRTILEKIFEPTVSPTPSLTMSLSGPGGVTNGGSVEAGTTGNVTISVSSFNQGIVRGTGIGAGWVSNGNQGVRAGAATSYTINNQNMGLTTSLTISSVTVVDGTTSYGNNSVSHATGIVPKNSLGTNSTSLTQLPAGTIAGNSVSFNGRRNLFYGTSSNVLDPPTSGTIRTLTTLFNPSLTTSFDLIAPIGTRTIVVAVPSGSTYGSVANGNFSVLDKNTNLLITNSFQSIAVSVPGANGYEPITYKVWYYINGAPSPEPSTYNIDLN